MKLGDEGLHISASGAGESEACLAIIGKSPAMRCLFRELESVGRTDASVLIEGETGVGKNLIARAIHLQGPRSDRPFVALSAANIPEPLFESEFFGHVKGAFSGAMEGHKGLAKAADGGTLFIDEVGELSLVNQAKLLSFLDRKEVRPVGGLRQIKVDVRLISATNQDLQALVRQREFRRDLYYRLRVIPLRVPSLRERREDVPLLVNHFLKKLVRKYGQPTGRVTPEAMTKLKAHDWEGNVRQLQNEIERAYVLTPEGQDMLPEHLRLEDVSVIAPGQHSSLEESRRAAERRLIARTLERHRWNVSASARELGISRVGLTRKLKRLGLRRPGHEAARPGPERTA